MPNSASVLGGLADERFVSLTTYRRTGEAVSTPVWIARVIADDDRSRALLTRVFGGKYRLEYRVFMFIERLGKAGAKQRVLLRITAAGTPTI